MKTLLILIIIFFTTIVSAQGQKDKKPSDFLPEGYLIVEMINGDLNKDSLEDCFLIIKGTDKSKIINDKYSGELDRNRRGIIVLFNKDGRYEMVVRNKDCFFSENEGGGVYFPPELYVEIEKGNLKVNYGHGRYGHWSYTFRFQNSDFELIGYDRSNGGAVTKSETSINFLTKRKLEKVNLYKNTEERDEVFKETRTDIKVKRLIKLSEIKDFDNLDLSFGD
ncbi:MAG: hypothetical protein ABJ092_02085 [Gillisia sp.]